MRKLLMTTVLAGAAVLATTSAVAAAPDLSAVGYLAVPTAAFAALADASSVFNFSLSSSGADFAATLVNASPWAGNAGYKFSGFSATLCGSGGCGNPFSASFDDQILSLALAGPLSAGDYSLSIHGTAGTLGSSYTGSLSIGAAQVVQVPEPESYALFLAGLGLIATIARRRSRTD
jgi:hypothetical protein